jgi:hypothetical protein
VGRDDRAKPATASELDPRTSTVRPTLPGQQDRTYQQFTTERPTFASDDECYAEARRLLKENRAKLDAIVVRLLAHESLDEPEIYAAAGIARPAVTPSPAPVPA